MKRDNPRAHTVPDHLSELEQLEHLCAGTRIHAGDGRQFIRTDRYCESFCDLDSGRLCTAKDVLFDHGGVAAFESATPVLATTGE
ncbi:hypothetical protein [Massilia sp. TS11]|uniref:hypothetical protein n=1 Tax=Massilia sp. TS11 TaxID=2908003 RepID=UPI001EDBE083|nr:hypothetical protein [Massilia sp. TS11]MCG2583867.1 hypothetical protein [Massilia sp. TS11]